MNDNLKNIKRKFKRSIKKFVYLDSVHKFTSWLLYLYVKLVLLTSKKVYVTDRKRYIEDIQSKNPIIHVAWHGRLLTAAVAIPDNLKRQYSVIASKHKDGQYAGELMEFFGFGNIKGSSIDPRKGKKSKGSLTAIRKMMSELKKGRGICLTPDGPRGPRYKMQSESLNIAKAVGGATVIPFTYSSTRGIKLKTWDEFFLPFPFGKMYIYLGKGVEITKETSKEEMLEITNKLEKELNKQVRELDKKSGK